MDDKCTEPEYEDLGLAAKRPQKIAPPHKPEQNSSNTEYDYAAVNRSVLALDVDSRSKKGYVNVK